MFLYETISKDNPDLAAADKMKLLIDVHSSQISFRCTDFLAHLHIPQNFLKYES